MRLECLSTEDPLACGFYALVGHFRGSAERISRKRSPPQEGARISIEQASTLGWERYVGDSGRIIGMKTFGASAPLKELQKKFGFEPENLVAAAKELLGRP